MNYREGFIKRAQEFGLNELQAKRAFDLSSLSDDEKKKIGIAALVGLLSYGAGRGIEKTRLLSVGAGVTGAAAAMHYNNPENIQKLKEYLHL